MVPCTGVPSSRFSGAAVDLRDGRLASAVFGLRSNGSRIPLIVSSYYGCLRRGCGDAGCPWCRGAASPLGGMGPEEVRFPLQVTGRKDDLVSRLCNFENTDDIR